MKRVPLWIAIVIAIMLLLLLFCDSDLGDGMYINKTAVGTTLAINVTLILLSLFNRFKK